jgi:dihydrofolate reductase
MATLIYSAAMSLDGFIAGPGGDMSWLSAYVGGENAAAERLLANTGALLVGNTTFGGDDPNRGTENEGAFGGRYHGPVVVLTHRPPADPPEGVAFRTDLAGAVAAAAEAAGDKYVSILGADVAKQCLEAGLLDEVLVFVVPVLLGDGVPLFRSDGGTTVRLTPIPGQSEHWYRVGER